ncbi:MAG: 4Fe-4S binding protein [Adlercreutzia equolifaciens]
MLGRQLLAVRRRVPRGIDLHHPEASVSLAECTKCGECRDACPAHAISFPLLARTEKAGLPVASAAQEADEDAVGAGGLGEGWREPIQPP